MPTASARASAVLASAAAGFEGFIATLGGDPDKVVEEAGLSLSELREPTHAIPLAAYCDLLDHASTRTHDPHFGFHYGAQFTPEMFGLIGFIALASPTAGGALNNFCEFFPLHQSDTESRLVRRDGLLRMEYRIGDRTVSNRRQDAEFTIAAFANVARAALGDRLSPVRIEFEHDEFADAHTLEQFFDAEIAFGQPTNALVMRDHGLDRQVAGSNHALLATLKASLKALNCGQSTTRQDLFGRLRAAIRARLRDNTLSLQSLADEFHVPVWTLQRRLADSGVTFSELVEQVRRDLADHYFRDPRITITEMAFLLGYSETSAFSRAFRKWHGVSPRALRGGRAAGRDL